MCDNQWSMRFEGEEVKVVALGTAWVAAITSLNFLRIFTEGGLQVCDISNDSPFLFFGLYYNIDVFTINSCFSIMVLWNSSLILYVLMLWQFLRSLRAKVNPFLPCLSFVHPSK